MDQCLGCCKADVAGDFRADPSPLQEVVQAQDALLNLEEEEDPNPVREEALPGQISTPQAGAPAPGPTPKAGDLALGRYRVIDHVLGEGGWCTVRRALHTQSGEGFHVALKTFRDQALRDSLEGGLGERFAREVATFQALGLSRLHDASGSASVVVPRSFARTRSKGLQLNPRDLFVNLLDYSRPARRDLTPGAAPDGRYYSVLELGSVSLEAFLDRRASSRKFLAMQEVRDVARALAAGLWWMHDRGLCHCDVKPANLLQFGDCWKLIDLEGAVPASSTELDIGCFTALYAAPEIAQAALQDREVVSGASTVLRGLAEMAKADVWAAGVVLLDVLAHECAFQESFSGYQAPYLMDMDAEEDRGLGFLKDWYEWLADAAPVKLSDFVSSPKSSAEMLEACPELCDLLSGLLAKRPEARLTSEEFLRHPFLALDLELQDPASGQRQKGAPTPTAQGAEAKVQAAAGKRSLLQRCCRAMAGRR